MSDRFGVIVPGTLLPDNVCPGCGFKGSVRTHARYDPTCTPEMRFWGKVKYTPTCWLWQGTVNTTGYGMASWTRESNIVAHRLAWQLLRGEIPAGKLMLHKCDTPRCVNPDHFFFGTDKENHDDSRAKDRHARGERTRRNKLTEDQAKEILSNPPKMGRLGNTIEYAERYNVSIAIIQGLVAGRTWKYLPRRENG